MSKKAPKTYNHYVPQFYLKNFSGNNSIGRYNFGRKEFVDEVAIKDTAGRNFLYGKNSDLEDWFQNLEGIWATIIRNILLYEKFPMDSVEYTYLIMFVYLSDVRVAEIADEFKRTNLEEGKNVARILADQGKIEISDEFIENLDVQIDRPNLPYIQGMKKIIPIISDLCPLIIVNESGLGFITSDVPVVKYNQWFLERGYRHPFGFGHMGCQCFVPLSAKICFCLFDDIVYKNQFGNKGRIRLYDEKDVEELNRLFMLNSYAEIYYRKNEEEWLRKNIREKVTEEKDEWILGSPQIGYLQKISMRSVYDRVKLPMFKTNAFFKTAPFPYSDEVGPLRKAVYEKMDEDIKN